MGGRERGEEGARRERWRGGEGQEREGGRGCNFTRVM